MPMRLIAAGEIKIGVIGIGGMGEVRRVKDRVLNRVPAMKVIHEELVQRPIGTARFIEEADWCSAPTQHRTSMIWGIWKAVSLFHHERSAGAAVE